MISLKNLSFLTATFILFMLYSCKQQEPTIAESTQVVDGYVKSRIDSTLNAYIQSNNVAGISALVFEKGKETYFGAFGMADRDQGKPMNRKTLVQIYSMTKPITGTALMTLYDQGKFQLDDPVSKYAPEFANLKVYAGEDKNGKAILEEPHRPLTIRDVTRHTSGFGNSADVPEKLNAMIKEADALNRNNTLVQMAEKLGSTPLFFHPGERWEYGPSVDVQAFLVERISGQKYGDYVREHVLDPMGMKETRYFVPEEDRGRFSAMYRREGEGELVQLSAEDSKSDYFTKWPLDRGGWGLTSTLDDYMLFTQMIINGGSINGVKILEPETVKLMSTNHLDESIKERSWLPSKGQVGFGIDFAVRLREPASAEENNGVVGEFFWDGAASTLFWIDPVNELTAVMFVQLFPYDQIKLHKNFRDAVYGKVSK